jgi:hypothetical protein
MSKSFKIILIAAIVAIAVGVVFLLKRTKSDSMAQYVPKSAIYICKINLGQIKTFFETKKDQILNLDFWQKEMPNRNSTLYPMFREIVKHPIETGISFDENAYYFREMNGFSALILPINNLAAFEKILADKIPSSASKTEENKVHFVELRTGFFVAWNGEAAAVCALNPDHKPYLVNLLNKNIESIKNITLFNSQSSNAIAETFIKLDLFAKLPAVSTFAFQIKNPFPADSYLHGLVDVNQSTLTQQFTIISDQQNKIDSLNFFKSKSYFDLAKRKLFLDPFEPYTAFAMSVEPDKLFHFILSLSPDLKQYKTENLVHEIAHSIAGEMSIGISVDTAHIKGLLPSFNENSFKLVAQIDLLDDKPIQSILQKYCTSNSGVFQYKNLPVYAFISNHKLIIGEDANLMESIAKSGMNTINNTQFVGAPSPFFNSPFAGYINTSVLQNYSNRNAALHNVLAIHSTNVTDGENYLFFDKSIFNWQFKSRDKNANLLLLFMSDWNKTYDLDLELSTE